MDQKTQYNMLLHCLGIETDEVKAGWHGQLSSSDWDEVIQQSARHAVAPLLCYRFKTNDTDVHIPTEIMETLLLLYHHSCL